jgi:hypothetical protein
MFWVLQQDCETVDAANNSMRASRDILGTKYLVVLRGLLVHRISFLATIVCGNISSAAFQVLTRTRAEDDLQEIIWSPVSEVSR